MPRDMKIESRSLVNMELAVEWTSPFAQHRDVRVFEKFNVWRDLDLLPDIMQKTLPGQVAGDKATFSFLSGELLPERDDRNIHCIAVDDFRKAMPSGLLIQPRAGRFYPQGWLRGLHDVYHGNMQPCRLIEIADKHMVFDFNHPLASYELEISTCVHDVEVNVGEHGGRCNDVMADLLRGPGMQIRHPACETDFFAEASFTRTDQNNDEWFYAMPRMVDHLDSLALQKVQALYASVLQPQSRILDLMSSVHSHLPASLVPGHVTGLGMNRQELEANTLLNERVIHNLNENTRLPFADEQFDAVVCTVSVEYLIHPVEVFREVLRVLRPGGVFINTFSNRWFPVKVISIWPEMHEFERLGLVSDYYRRAGGFRDLHTFSLRGLSRPVDDVHAGKTSESDPVYAVWGFKP